MTATDRWIRFPDGRYFVRFGSPRSRTCMVHVDYREAYCFAHDADARRVLDQLLSYGHTATIVGFATRPATPRTAPPPPPPPVNPFEPPDSIYAMADRILQASKHNSTGSTKERLKRGYRLLAREYHPDRGGFTKDMQTLNDAYQWLREHTPWAEAKLSWCLDDIPLEDEDIEFAARSDSEEAGRELTEDDIPF